MTLYQLNARADTAFADWTAASASLVAAAAACRGCATPAAMDAWARAQAPERAAYAAWKRAWNAARKAGRQMGAAA
jgi:hypothetical protein